MKHFIFILLLAALGTRSSAQVLNYATEKEKLYKRLTDRNISPAYAKEIDHFYNKVCDSLVNSNLNVDGDPIETILIRLFGNINMNLDRRKITKLRVPAVNSFFLELLKTYKKESIVPILKRTGLNQSAILANAFIGLPIGDSIQRAVNLREMVINTRIIPQKIYDPQYARYVDTVLHYFVNEDPERFIAELNNPQMQKFADASGKTYVKAAANLKGQKNLNKLIPFGVAIYENRITVDSVMLLAGTPQKYIKAYTDEVIRLRTSTDQTVKAYMYGYFETTHKELAKMFIEPINQLHESANKERFFVLNGLSAQDLYFIILGGESVFYTSSFLYTFNQFLARVEKEGLENFFERIGYYHFGNFLTVCGGYGMTPKLIQNMKEERFANTFLKYIDRHINSLQTDIDLILNGMTISEILYGIKDFSTAKQILIDSLNERKIRELESDVLIQRMYNGFKGILDDSLNVQLKAIEAKYEVMQVERLRSRDTIVQVGLFYDDEDGVTSFANYLNFLPAKDWKREDRGNYLVFQSTSGNPMFIYLNKVNTASGDGAAQDEMLKSIEDAGLNITYFTHRGHSYHLHKSIKKLPGTAELVYLGSCGGYNEVVKVFQANPDAHIISTRNIGSKFINDPILSRINAEAVANNDINWVTLWSDFGKSFTAKNTKELFSAYIPPNKYIGIIFVRQVFNF